MYTRFEIRSRYYTDAYKYVTINTGVYLNIYYTRICKNIVKSYVHIIIYNIRYNHGRGRNYFSVPTI